MQSLPATGPTDDETYSNSQRRVAGCLACALQNQETCVCGIVKRLKSPKSTPYVRKIDIAGIAVDESPVPRAPSGRPSETPSGPLVLPVASQQAPSRKSRRTGGAHRQRPSERPRSRWRRLWSALYRVLRRSGRERCRGGKRGSDDPVDLTSGAAFSQPGPSWSWQLRLPQP